MGVELDNVTLARARSGDRVAQAAFVETYQDRVFAVCMALAGPDAEDCAQESLIAALGALRRFQIDGPARLSSFVLAIARHRCIDRARSARVRRWAGDIQPDQLEVSADAIPDSIAVQRAVLALPEDQRLVIALRVWGELEYEEIATIANIPVGTVRSRLSRAREALRAVLDEREPLTGASR
jgi:RNA polymerase sigma-70 factor, ECF subfamily